MGTGKIKKSKLFFARSLSFLFSLGLDGQLAQGLHHANDRDDNPEGAGNHNHGIKIKVVIVLGEGESIENLNTEVNNGLVGSRS